MRLALTHALIFLIAC